jgi:hypothetical protein
VLFSMKMARMALSRPLAMPDPAGLPFRFSLMPAIEKHLHWITFHLKIIRSTTKLLDDYLAVTETKHTHGGSDRQTIHDQTPRGAQICAGVGGQPVEG